MIILLCASVNRKNQGEFRISRQREIYHRFETKLQLIMRDWQKLGKEEPLTTFDDYTAVLLPGDYRGWTEVRDLMVIRLYEQLHDLVAKDTEPEEVEE